MKAITLYQPWATLVALGKKKIETRSWKTDYRGPLAIHVAKKFTGDQRLLCSWGKQPFSDALQGVFWDKKEIQNVRYGFAGSVIQGGPCTEFWRINKNYHLGCVIAVCNLVDVVEILDFQKRHFVTSDDLSEEENTIEIDYIKIPPAEPELSFGDYTPGRYAWILQDVQMLEKPVPAKGMQRLWEWDEGKVNSE